jgi:hypothetical protein
MRFGENFDSIIWFQMLDKFRTGNFIIDSILITLLLSIIRMLSKQLDIYIEDYGLSGAFFSADHITSWVWTQNVIEYEGKISYITSTFDSTFTVSPTFSNRFRALWDYIVKRIDTNKSIYKIKEYSFTISRREGNEPIYIVSQDSKFLLDYDKQIYAYTYVSNENNEATDGKKQNNKIEKIKIVLYSNKSSISDIKLFVENITNNYLENIATSRHNKQFVYTLTKTKFEDYIYECWNETIFESSRSFDNLFFEQRNYALRKIDFFLNNKAWYFEKGIPYSLGIGLYGDPGTGKTSFIKALATYTKRHIIVISLKLIKNKADLETFFFERIYNVDNKKNPIDFSNKIIVFEDIDCVGNIVHNRATNNNNNNSNSNIESSQTNKLVEVLSNTLSLNGEKNGESDITLDDILNLWDGIRETPGRIMVISSNHYDKLDPALVRPGRIDLTLEMSLVTRQIIKELYEKWFANTPVLLTDDILNKIENKFYSPAELINIYVSSNNNPTEFLDRLLLNKHI